ncbi:MAG: helix-turn-helix transcriptional regulator [Planctomycetota bacterium]|nr:helix-turn-helix transcriptional regulator [Planctomycetota bacterium]
MRYLQYFSGNPPSILALDAWTMDRHWRVEPRCLDDTWLIIATGARPLALSLGTATYPLTTGAAALIPEHAKHSLQLGPGRGGSELLSVHMRWNDRWGRPLAACWQRPTFAAPAWLRATLPGMIDRWQADPDCTHSEAVGLIVHLLAHDLAASKANYHAAPPAAPSMDPRLQAALLMIDQDSRRGLTVTDLAAACGISPQRLRVLFRHELGTSPKTMIITRRLAWAAHELRTSSTTVGAIAEQCGYAQARQFFLDFRKRYGCTPRGWRERQM